MFQKATKTTCKLRGALHGPSGAGKTFTALRMATGMGGTIAVIDTEHGSASKYADRFAFDVCELADKTIAGYIAAIAKAGDYDILIVDSLSHAWQELLEEVDRLANTKYRGNTWSAWSEGTPKQKKLVQAILSFPGHVIVTMRSKTEWTVQEANGKKKPVRMGLAPEQGKGIEYEFDLLMQLSIDHVGTVAKDRTGKFQDLIIEKPGEDFGKALADWLQEGDEPEAPGEDIPDGVPGEPPPPEPVTAADKEALVGLAKTLLASAGRIEGKTKAQIRDKAIEIVSSIAKSVILKDRIETVEQLTKVRNALESGKYGALMEAGAQRKES